jgi:hypothetical protein
MSSENEKVFQRKVQLRRALWFSRIEKRLDLISFEEIADWCARRAGGVEHDAVLRMQAYRDLERAVLRGEFGLSSKPMVAYLPRVPHADFLGRLTLRLTDNQMFWLGELSSAPHLWAPRHLCIRWFKSRGIPVPSWLVASSHETKWRTAIIADPALSGPSQLHSQATDEEIDEAIFAIYQIAKVSGSKPPNVRELLRPVIDDLAKRNRRASYDQIMDRAGQSQFLVLRRPPGATLKSEKRRQERSNEKKQI